MGSVIAAGVPAIVEFHDRDEWNALVLGFDGAHVRQGWEWGEVRREVEGPPLRYAAYDGGVPLVAQAVTAPRPLGLPLAVVYGSGGPLLRGHGQAAPAGLIQLAREVAARTRAVFLRVTPGTAADDGIHDALVQCGFVALPDEWTVWNAPRTVMVLDLRPSEAELKRQMRESTRLALTRAQRYGARLECESSPAVLSRFYRLLRASAWRKGHPVQAWRFFEALRREYLERRMGCLAVVSKDGRDLAGALGVRFGPRAYLLYACIDPDSEDARRQRAGTAVHWAVIQWAKASGCDLMDWGSLGTRYPPGAGAPGFGIYDFKVGFGCSLRRRAGYYDLVFRPGLYRVFRLLERRCAGLAWRVGAKLAAVSALLDGLPLEGGDAAARPAPARPAMRARPGSP
jgi:lipid II:glycine glycyltransferase (peptidoglycan interpeptide bridge formation enzyme)